MRLIDADKLIETIKGDLDRYNRTNLSLCVGTLHRVILQINEQPTANNKDHNIFYLCDKKQCVNCHYPTCKHTHDITHAKNFKKSEGFETDNLIWETEVSDDK
jgi:hypothetical protein